MPTPKILVVDDEPGVLHLVSRALSLRGYEVHAASSPKQALAIAEALPLFDLVVSDVLMPGMSGTELVNRVSELCPAIGIILMSAQVLTGSLPEHAIFLSKPFPLRDLYAIVEEKLASTEAFLALAG